MIMKRLAYLLSLTTAAVFLAFMAFTGCEGPAGPPGADGLDGMDANATCTQCHNENTDIFVKSLQASVSKHMTGGNFERNDAECAACHTHEGFIERMDAGEMEASAAIENPSPTNCRTCHKIHETYTSADLELRYPEPVSLWVNDVTVDLGAGNICANCHQPFIPDPMFGTGLGDKVITDSRFGPHHGPQSAMVWGTGAYEVAGSKSYPTPGGHPHAGAGCTQCHMPPAFGIQAGGHTLKMVYESHGHEADYTAGCTMCHEGIEEFDYHGLQTEVAELIDSLHGVLMGMGILDEDGLVDNTPLTVSSEMVGYIYNYKFVEEDLSRGVHNPRYSVALLTNTLEALKSN
jgi:hypothetical protein